MEPAGAASSAAARSDPWRRWLDDEWPSELEMRSVLRAVAAVALGIVRATQYDRLAEAAVESVWHSALAQQRTSTMEINLADYDAATECAYREEDLSVQEFQSGAAAVIVPECTAERQGDGGADIRAAVDVLEASTGMPGQPDGTGTGASVTDKDDTVNVQNNGCLGIVLFEESADVQVNGGSMDIGGADIEQQDAGDLQGSESTQVNGCDVEEKLDQQGRKNRKLENTGRTAPRRPRTKTDETPVIIN